MPRISEVIIEADSQVPAGYVLQMGDYRADFVEARDRFQSVTTFRFVGVHGTFLARQEVRGGNRFWYAFQRFGKHVRKVYIGKHHRVDLGDLEEAAKHLHDVTQWLATRENHTVPQVLTSDWLTPPS